MSDSQVTVRLGGREARTGCCGAGYALTEDRHAPYWECGACGLPCGLTADPPPLTLTHPGRLDITQPGNYGE